MIHLASELRVPSAPTPTISQSTAKTGVSPSVSDSRSGRRSGAAASSPTGAGRRRFCWPLPAPRAAFSAAQFDWPAAPAQCQHGTLVSQTNCLVAPDECQRDTFFREIVSGTVQPLH